jgi:hypothetical protein
VNAADIVRQAEAYASEWIEMSENPATVVVGVLATKIVHLQEHIDYLEKRITDDISRTTRIN